MREWLIEFLRELEVAFPPAPGKHYAVAYARYGNETDGWQDRLAVTIRKKDREVTLFLDDTDFSKTTEDLINDILLIPMNPSEQSELTLAEVLAEFAAQQKPLEPDISKIVHDNLWNMLEP